MNHEEMAKKIVAPDIRETDALPNIFWTHDETWQNRTFHRIVDALNKVERVTLEKALELAKGDFYISRAIQEEMNKK